MALNTSAASGPPGPGVITQAKNDRLVTSLVANEFVGIWKNRPAHAEVCNRRWQSEWSGTMIHGDTLRIPVLPRYRVISGYSSADEDTFQPQKELAPYVDIHFRQPNKLETAKDIFDKNLWVSPMLESQKAKRKVQSLVDTVETDIAKIEAGQESGSTGYHRAVQSVKLDTTTPGDSVCVAPGPESTNFPGVALYTKARASLVARGVTGREFCALLSPNAMEAYSRGALNAPYELPWGGEAARKAMVTGPGKVGWKFVESVHNETYTYTDFIAAGNTTATVHANVAEGATTVTVTGLKNGSKIPIGTVVQFAGSNSVNEVLGNASTMLESYVTTQESGTITSARVTLNLDHAVRSSTAGDGKRTRNCTKQPAAGDVVYFNGLSTANGSNRGAIDGTVTVDQSHLVVRDACALIVAQPELPTDTITSRMVSADSYRVAAAHIRWFEGQSKSIRDSLLMRYGAGVTEGIAGLIARGAASGDSALI